MQAAELTVQINQPCGNAGEIAVPRKGGRHHLYRLNEGRLKINKALLRSAKFCEIIELAFRCDNLGLRVGFAIGIGRGLFDQVGEADQFTPHGEIEDELRIFNRRRRGRGIIEQQR